MLSEILPQFIRTAAAVFNIELVIIIFVLTDSIYSFDYSFADYSPMLPTNLIKVCNSLIVVV